MQSKTTFKNALMAALIAGIGAAIVNNLYSAIYTSVTGFSMPEVIHVGSITGSSIFPLLIGGIVYYFLQKKWAKGGLYFVIAAVVFTILSLGGPFMGTQPDGSPFPAGFAALTAPMHFIAGGFAVMIPNIAHRIAGKKADVAQA